MTRQKSWLELYAEYTAYGESPEIYNLWTGLFCISTVLARNVWIDQGRYTLYPNQYIILVGPPGKVGKGTAMGMGKSLLKGVEGLRFIPDSLTREDIIRRMAKAGGTDKDAIVTIFSKELSSLIDPSGIMTVSFLTDIYDGHEEWKYSTKHQGRDKLRRPLINLLAATTPTWISTDFPVEAIGHGFTRRTVFVYADEPSARWPFPPALDEELAETLTDELRRISTLSGEFQITEEGKEVYTEIYHKIYDSDPDDYRIEGFHWMKKIHVLKVAMALSASEGSSMQIAAHHIQSAWTIVNAVENDMTKAFSSAGKYEHASDLERILGDIRKANGLEESQIFEKNYAIGDVQDISKILQLLQAMGKVKREKNNLGEFTYLPV